MSYCKNYKKTSNLFCHEKKCCYDCNKRENCGNACGKYFNSQTKEYCEYISESVPE